MYAREKEPKRMSKPPEIDYPTFQEALDAALAMGDGTLLNVKNCTASATVRLPAGTLVSQSPESPPGVNLLPAGKVRAGDAVKDEYLDRLRAGLEDGCISLEEFSARSDAIMEASTKEHLDLFTRDLPARKKEVSPAPPEPPTVFCWFLNLFMIVFPVLAGIGVLFGQATGGTAALALAGGTAGLILTCMGRTGMK